MPSRTFLSVSIIAGSIRLDKSESHRKRAADAALFDVSRKSLSHDPGDEVEDERDGNAEDTDEVDVDTVLIIFVIGM